MTPDATVVPEPSPGLCSVIMPCFRMGRFIGAALDSLAAQAYGNWELIVVDDCGPDDGTRDTVEAFAARHLRQRVEFIRHDVNRGVSMARRTAFMAARGEYVAFLDPDDAYLPEKLDRHVGILERNPEVALVHGAITAVDATEDTKRVMESAFRLGPDSRTYSLSRQPWHLQHNRINNSTVVCRKSAIDSGDFPEQLCFQAEDWFLWLQVARRGLFFYDPVPLTMYRCHDDSFSMRTFFRPGALALAHLEILAACYPGAPDEERRRLASSMLDQLYGLVAQRAAAAGMDGPTGTRHLVRWLIVALVRTVSARVRGILPRFGLRRSHHADGRP